MQLVRLASVTTLLTSIALAIACASEETPPSQAIWAPTTVPYDPTCASGCVELDRRRMTHIGAELVLLAQKDVDDPIAQWSRCIDSFMSCVEDRSEARDCVSRSSCPAVCKSRFDAQTVGALDAAALLDAYEAIFVVKGAFCRPTEEVSP